MTDVKQQDALALIAADGEIIELGESLPALTVEQAEALYPQIVTTQDRLKRLADFAKSIVLDAWRAREQREGILGGARYERKSTPGTYVYQAESLFTALKPFVGKVITEEERIEALGWSYEPPRTVSVPEVVRYAPSTAQLNAFASRSKQIAAVIEAHRTREPGADRLVPK